MELNNKNTENLLPAKDKKTRTKIWETISAYNRNDWLSYAIHASKAPPESRAEWQAEVLKDLNKLLRMGGVEKVYVPWMSLDNDEKDTFISFPKPKYVFEPTAIYCSLFDYIFITDIDDYETHIRKLEEIAQTFWKIIEAKDFDCEEWLDSESNKLMLPVKMRWYEGQLHLDFGEPKFDRHHRGIVNRGKFYKIDNYEDCILTTIQMYKNLFKTRKK